MPIPEELDDDSYKLISSIQSNFAINQNQGNRRQSTSKSFHVYLELYFQAKHDRAVHAFCLSKGIECRRTDGTQVKPKNDNSNDPCIYYQPHAEAMVDEVISQMQQRWTQNNYNNTVFVVGQKNMANIQRKRINGYSYEMSYWYDVGDIYIAFHCYPN